MPNLATCRDLPRQIMPSVSLLAAQTLAKQPSTRIGLFRKLLITFRTVLNTSTAWCPPTRMPKKEVNSKLKNPDFRPYLAAKTSQRFIFNSLQVASLHLCAVVMG